MDIEAKFAGREVGYDVPAIPGMSEDEIQTPCLILELDALERNIRKMGDYARAHNMRPSSSQNSSCPCHRR
jgi:3-hydroxy-D-aspartate aldolase